VVRVSDEVSSVLRANNAGGRSCGGRKKHEAEKKSESDQHKALFIEAKAQFQLTLIYNCAQYPS
jgi:hypothetical protein